MFVKYKMIQLKNKKAMELSLQTIAILIISVIVMIVVIYFFASHYTQGSSDVTNIGNSILDTTRK